MIQIESLRLRLLESAVVFLIKLCRLSKHVAVRSEHFFLGPNPNFEDVGLILAACVSLLT